MIPAMLRWIHRWWIADRIRFTPGHCRLFQLAVGDRVLVRNRLWVVVDRREAIAEDHVNVQFQLAELDEEHSVFARLSVELQDLNTRLPKVSWSCEAVEAKSSAAGSDSISNAPADILNADRAEELFEEDVVVLKDRLTFI